MHSVYIGIGSNILPRLYWIVSGIDELLIRKIIINPVFSKAYVAAPWGKDAEGYSYINLVLRGSTRLDPGRLLNQLISVELSMHRERYYKNAPRTLDLDILLYEDFIIDQPGLIIPHRLIKDRRFVLKPLIDLAPKLIHPVFKKSIDDLAKTCKDSCVVKPLCKRGF